MTSDIIRSPALAEFRGRLAGDFVLPGDPSYDESRAIFNGMIDRHPAIIARCANPNDVILAIRAARDLGLEIAVRSGGHGVAGRAVTEGGLVIDLRRMDTVTVDPAARTANVGGGAPMSRLDRATQPYNLATTGGRVSTTGVGGFTLGGGSGWIERKFGLACDNLLAVEVVTADGEVVRASDDENADLFWALHGGGGNFGVATSFTFRLHPLPAMTIAMLLWRPEAGPEVVRAYRDFMETAPDEVGGGVFYITGPPEEFVPEHLVGRLVCAVIVTYTGGEQEARGVLEPLCRLGHDGEMLAELPYADLQCMLDDPPGYRNYWSAEHLDAFPDNAVDAFCDLAGHMIVPSPSQQVLLPMGGAVGRGPSGYPIPWRQAEWVVHPLGLWEKPADDVQARRWASAVRTDLKPWASGAVYLNFIGDEGQERVVAGLGRENYTRLAEVKARYDPGNVFRLNHNIKPAVPPQRGAP
ncbi:FAD-binding oxidoreductase [Streptosporangium sp. KLBMP 9127]|nr:FAD-binding oxidoreductase [Streptosporangium sp. KLBMP 9127]